MASNIDTVGTMKMAQVLHELNMLTCLHKYYPLEQLIDFFTTNPASRSTFYTLGIRDEDFDKLKRFVRQDGRSRHVLSASMQPTATRSSLWIGSSRSGSCARGRSFWPATWRPRKWCRNS